MVAEVRQAFARLELPPPLLEDARLLVSELVANSIRHAGLGPDDRILITARWSGRKLRVDVRDRPPASAPSPVSGVIRPPAGAQSGWGLYLVDRLSSRWGAMPGRYWFELEVDEREEEGERGP